MRRSFALAAVFAVLLPAVAWARTQQEVPYAKDRVWNTALRLVRVDLGFPLGERDADTGFFLFEYVDGARRVPGSIELVPTRVENHDGVRVVVQIPAMPGYVERMILDRLSRKLIDEYGLPPRPARPAPRDPVRDGQDGEPHPDAPTPGDGAHERQESHHDRGQDGASS